MPEPYDKTLFSPWGVFKGNDIYWLGMARDADETWTIALGWPSQEEIDYAKSQGLYAASVGIVPR